MWARHERLVKGYLEEDFPKDTVCLFPEDRREDDSDPVMRGLDIDGFLITIMDCH